MMSARQALRFIEQHGVVLIAARDCVPCLVEVIVGEPIRGSWWAHAQSHGIFAVVQKVVANAELLPCRLIDGKLTLVHRRLWPALVKLAYRFTPEQLAQVRQVHTPSGRHINRVVSFPDWVPQDVLSEARQLDDALAGQLLAPVLPFSRGSRPARAAPGRHRSRRRR
jgi:hypothetical protein